MTYSLPDDVEKIRSFCKVADSYFAVIPQIFAPLLGSNPVLQSGVASALNQQTPSFRLILRKTVPIMLCIAWEGFVEELKTTDPARYATHFQTGFELYYNEDIREVFLLRNCIIHCMGKIDATYLQKSLIKTFSVVGTAVDFTEVQLDTHFKLFNDAYAQVTI